MAPLVVPLALNVAVAVVPESKHVVAVVKFRLVTLISLLLPCVSVALKTRAAEPLELVRVADQLPVNVLLELLPPPQAINIIAAVHRIERRKSLMLLSPGEQPTGCQRVATSYYQAQPELQHKFFFSSVKK